MLVSVEMRTCLWHPTKIATSWCGHAHIKVLGQDAHIIVGFCEDCRISEQKNPYSTPRASEKDCLGCYGNLMDNQVR